MRNGNRTVLIAAGVAFAALVAGGAWYAVSAGEEQAARAAVNVFAQKMRNVPLSGNPEAARQTIRENYAGLVTESLLDFWLADPSQAPGRAEEGSYPDGIEIVSAARQGAGYVMTGRVLYRGVEAATTSAPAATPVVIQLIRENSRWLIAAYQVQRTAPAEGESGGAQEETQR